MENNKPFFDPYTFSMSQMQQQQAIPNPVIPELETNLSNQTKYYEQQYMYYKYLTQMLDYKIKLKEYEKNFTPPSPPDQRQNAK